MKKKFTYFVAAVCAALTFSACSSDKLEAYSGQTLENPESPSNAISFGTYMGKTGTTRAGVVGAITTETLKTGAHNAGFGVFGYRIDNSTWATSGASTAPNFMYNQQVKWNSTSGAWEYSPVKYWPNGTDAANAANSPSNTATSDNDDKLNFFAYAPYVALSESALDGVGITKINGQATKGGATSTGNQKQGDPTVDYKLSVTNLHTAANVDLLWGLRGDATYSQTSGTTSTGTVGTGYNVDLTKQTVDEKVSFLFKHALAKIGGKSGLKIVADIDGNGAGLGGYGTLDSKTCITVRSINIKNKGDEAFVESGTFDLATGTWSNLTNASSNPANGALISETISDGTSPNIAMNSEIYKADGSAAYSSGWTPLGVTTTAKDVYATAGQDAFYLIPGSTVTLTVAVNYDISTYDTNINGNYVRINQTITNDVTVSVPANAANKFYTLVLHLGLTSVKFSAEVADWDNAETGVVEEVWLPSNVVSESTAVSLATGTGATVNTAATQTTYTITVTGLTSSKEWSAVVSSGDATISTASGTTASTSQDVTVTLVANDSTTETKQSVITFTCDGAVTTVTIIQAKKTA